MEQERGLPEAAELFKVLGNRSRLGLLRQIEREPRTVGALAEAVEMSPPLVSQHLRTLRQAGLVSGERHGKEMIYRIADHHVTHIVADALTHVLESDHAPQPGGHEK